MKTHKSICTRSVALSVCLIGLAVLMLGAALAGCSFSNTTGPTNSGPLSLLRNEIQAAGITSLEGGEGPSEVAAKGELYLRVLGVEGQDPRVTADRLLSLAQKYRKQLRVDRLHVVIESSQGVYDHTFDFDASPTSTGTTRQTGFVTTEQATVTSNTTAISEAEAISIAKEYIDQVDREHTTTTVPTGAKMTDGWVPAKVEVTSAVLGKPTSLYGPSGFDGPVWTIKMTTSKTTFTVVVVIDAMTGKVVGGIIW